MKSLTRRELLTEIFSKDMLKKFAGAYKEFNNAQNEAKKLSCEEAAFMIGKNSKKHYKNFIKNSRKEG